MAATVQAWTLLWRLFDTVQSAVLVAYVHNFLSTFGSPGRRVQAPATPQIADYAPSVGSEFDVAKRPRTARSVAVSSSVARLPGPSLLRLQRQNGSCPATAKRLSGLGADTRAHGCGLCLVSLVCGLLGLSSRCAQVGYARWGWGTLRLNPLRRDGQRDPVGDRHRLRGRQHPLHHRRHHPDALKPDLHRRLPPDVVGDLAVSILGQRRERGDHQIPDDPGLAGRAHHAASHSMVRQRRPALTSR